MLLQQQVDTLKTRVAEQEKRIQELEARLNQNSSNSSRPPSSDPPWKKRYPPKVCSGGRPGGQMGHPGYYRQPLPVEQVDIQDYVPTHCARCQHPLPADKQPGDPEPLSHQVTEMPPVAVKVTDYRSHGRQCPVCGFVTRGEIPAEVRDKALGPRVTAALSLLAGYCHLSNRKLQELMARMFHAAISSGSIAQYLQETSAALQAPYEAIGAQVSQASHKHVDETSWKLNGQICWLWVAANAQAAFYKIQKSRGASSLKALLGQFVGWLCSDRYSVYASWLLGLRQICWSHLKRDFKKYAEGLEAGRELGVRCGELTTEVFRAWQDFKAGVINRHEMQCYLEPVQKELKEVLARGRDSPDRQVRTFSKHLLSVYPALWTFATVEGVEPTNNLAERMLRPAVMWRKCCFGNQSEEGCRFTERILTVVQTLRLQNRPVLEYLQEAITAARCGQPAPAIV